MRVQAKFKNDGLGYRFYVWGGFAWLNIVASGYNFHKPQDAALAGYRAKADLKAAKRIARKGK